MRLKSLKLAGFKSFANTTTFTFAHGITAIVGPNGCGKSNVIDAIRWVLGETSAKQLRGGAMSDVIFAGTQEKSAKSVASVELTFEHTQDEQTGIRHEFNLYHELSVRRQINMEGRSDYFINGTRCRRRDVIDVFLGTGLSARSYAVIEQGMIGRIVESNPMQLREFIEEAAGVSRYQARRLETQKNLEKTQENLTRLYDIQSELERQKKILSKQAASAQQHNELSETLLDIKQQLAIQQLYQAKHTQQQQKSSHEQSAKITAALQADYESLKAKHDKLTAHINHEQWLKDDAQSAHYQQQLGLQQAEQQLNAALTQVTINEQNLIGFDAQRQQLMDEQARLTVKLQAQHHELAVLHPKLSELALRRDAHKQEELPLQRTWQQVQDRQLQLQEQERKLEQQLATNTQSLHHLKLNQNRWDIKQQHWQQIQQPDADSDNSLATQITALNKQIQQTARQQDSVASVIETLQPQWQALQQQVTEQQRRLTDYEKSQALLVGEYDTLHKIVHPKPIKAVQQGNLKINDNTDNEDNIAKPIVITLREQIELTAQGQQYAQLLDSVLTLWLESHVLVDHKSEKSASKLADSLWSALESHSSTLVTYSSNTSQQDKQHPSHSLWLPAKLKGNHDSFIQALPDDYVDKILPLSQLIAQPTLALWQQCYLYLPALEISAVNNNKALSAILKVLPPSALLLTTDGWIMSSLGTINLAKFINAHNAQHDNKGDDQFLSQRLSQRTRLSELTLQLDDFDNQIETQQQTIKRTQVDYDALLINLEEARAQAERLSQDNYRYHKQLTTQQGAYERQQADRQRLDADKVSLMAEQQELEQQSEALTIAQQHIKNDISSLTPELKATSTKRQQLQDRRNEFNRNRQLNDKAWQSLQLTMQKAEMSLEHSTDNLARVHAVYEQAVQSELAVQKRLETHKEQLPHLQASLHTAQTARDEQQALLIERENALTALKQDYSLQQSELEALQMKWQSQQSVVASQATQLALSTAQLQDIIHHTQDALDRYYLMIHKSNPQHSPSTVSVSSVLTDFITHERCVRPDRISELKSQCDDIQEQLSRIGAVNLAAVSELAELDKRLAPLTQQTADIAASIETLTEAISAIDETTKTLFLQTLDNVNRELAELFAKVFGGGHASLTLDISSMPDNTSKSEQWRAGLTLMAQPKGKRNSRLAVLSGGEKTLTALSLIFAIFKQHPAPFCVLDEVDAPLDDANVARFTSLIHELAANLQFIFISHNKLAMQIADELKGITMPSAGISTLVNVSLAEAAQYIDS